jgi:hypothetical protein
MDDSTTTDDVTEYRFDDEPRRGPSEFRAEESIGEPVGEPIPLPFSTPFDVYMSEGSNGVVPEWVSVVEHTSTDDDSEPDTRIWHYSGRQFAMVPTDYVFHWFGDSRDPKAVDPMPETFCCHRFSAGHPDCPALVPEHIPDRVSSLVARVTDAPIIGPRVDADEGTDAEDADDPSADASPKGGGA